MLPNNTPRFTFTVGGLHFSVRRFKGDESISKLFEFELELVSKKSDIAFDSVINQMGRLTLQQFDDVEPRYVHGIVNYFEQRNKDGKYTNYYAQLVPLFWLFTQRQNCRIFQKLDVQKIIDDIFKKAGMPSDFYRFDLELTHPEREYCVQYRETEWNFITRLMEEEGIFCYFEHTESKAILVMQDHSYVHPPIPSPETVIFHEISGYAADEEHLFFFNYAESIRSGKATLRDFNLKKPTMDMERDKEADKTPELEVYDYPGLYEDPGIGQKLAKVRLEELQTPRKQGSGESTSVRFIPGYRFTLAQHPRKDFNKTYLITDLKQEGKQPQVLQEQAGAQGTEYTSELTCIPASVTYRPARLTRKPVVEGPQTAIVVGPSGEEIYVDKHGRVKVQFHWDREGQMNEKSSCWIRVSQLWAGQKWGAMYIPRIGQEVIVDFLEGDPDRPIITGRVYHGDNLPPYSPSQNKTKSTIKSHSSPGGGGFNEIRFEDKKGNEQVFIHAEKDYDLRVKNDQREYIGQDHNFMVKRDSKSLIEGGENLTVKGNRKVHVAKSSYREAKEELHERVGKKYFNKTGMEMHFKSGKKIVIDGSMDITLRAGGSFVRINASGVTIKGKMIKINSGGSPGKVRKAQSQSPAQPQEADNARPGNRFKAPPPPKTWEPIPVDVPTLAAQAATLKEAAKNGTPFCATCGQ